jgi:hypothetical protein
MAIPQHLLDAAKRHHEAGKKTALFVRHAERHPVLSLRTHESVLLTERGHEQAKAGGALLAKQFAQMAVAHSPVERCAETARGLVLGASSSGADAQLGRALEALGNPFVLDRQRFWEIVKSTGPTFIRAWFDGKLPADVFMPLSLAAQSQLNAIGAGLDEIDHGVGVFVSHDWNIALVREAVLGVTPEKAWPDFLDGIVVALDGSDFVVELDGRIGRRPRA